MVRISSSLRRSIAGTGQDRAVSRRALLESVDRAIHQESLGGPRWLIYSGDNRSTSSVAGECGNKDSKPVDRRRCQRRDDAAIAPRKTAAVEDVRTDNTPDNILDNAPEGVLDGNPTGTRDGVPALGRTDTNRAPGVAARKAANSRPASGRSCMADRTAGSMCDSSIPATWSQAGPGSRGGS